MTAKSSVAWLAAVSTCLATLSYVPLVWGQEASAPEKEVQERERPELPPLTSQVSPEEALAAIKRRAQRILAARRAAKRLKFYGELSQAIGYETNPSNSSSHKGDTYEDTSTYLMLSKRFTSTIDWQGTYSGNYLKYLDYGDGDYTDHVLTPVKLRWLPGRMWRVEAWSDLEHNFYPVGKDSSYRSVKFSGRVRQNLFDTWYHQAQYEWFVRDYATKNARDGAGTETTSDRTDTRHRIRYKVGTTVKKALLSVENEYYWHDSNDARSDFYDAEVWKISNAVSGNVTDRLYLSGGFNFERKNYRERPITGFVAPARYDDKYTMSSSASYDLDKEKAWKVAYGFTFDHLDSNEPSGEYDNAKHSLTLTAKF